MVGDTVTGEAQQLLPRYAGIDHTDEDFMYLAEDEELPADDKGRWVCDRFEYSIANITDFL